MQTVFRRTSRAAAAFGATGLVLAISWLPVDAAKPECETRSSATRVALIELYTSEGCNSCPPADRWVSSLPARGFDVDRVVPLVFHVDYWDYLGWRDRFAEAGFSARQRRQAARGGARFVYTPQLLLNGAELDQPFRGARFEDRLATANSRAAGAELRLIQRAARGAVTVELESRMVESSARPFSETYIALLENHLSSEVRAGENSGKVLTHDFVVRKIIGPLPVEASGGSRWSGTIALQKDWKRADLKLAVFAQDSRDGDVLQVLFSPLCRMP